MRSSDRLPSWIYLLILPPVIVMGWLVPQPTHAGSLETLQKDPGQWVTPAGTHHGTRFSELDQVNVHSVDDLEVAWTFSSGVTKGHEGQPLVVGNTMYLITPYPNRVFALDLTREGAPMKWQFSPDVDDHAKGVACCGIVNRGLAYEDGRLFFNTLDARTYALDADTGEVLWKVKQASVKKGFTMTQAPIVVNDKVITGMSGGNFGVRAFTTANDAETGERVWRAYSTGPDTEVLIGEDYEAPYDWLAGENLGKTTWPGDEWKRGGGAPWGWYTYDPDLDLLFYGTGNPGVMNPEMRGEGDNLWGSTVFARDPDTGKAKWAYQFTPHDEWDFDSVMENMVIDQEINGEMRKTLVHFDKNGFGYTLDRRTGEVLVAEPFVPVNWAHRINQKTGRPVRNPDKAVTEDTYTENICPTGFGGTNQQPSSYSPRTGLAYVPSNNICMDLKAIQINYIEGTPYYGTKGTSYAGPGGYRGALVAWDPANGEVEWSIRQDWPVWSGTLSTAGNLVFYGTVTGWFKAVNARTGEVVWKFKTGSGIVGAPMTYRGPDGKQYVAVWSGIGGLPGQLVTGNLDPDNMTQTLGLMKIFKDMGKYTNRGGMLYVFALDP